MLIRCINNPSFIGMGAAAMGAQALSATRPDLDQDSSYTDPFSSEGDSSAAYAAGRLALISLDGQGLQNVPAAAFNRALSEENTPELPYKKTMSPSGLHIRPGEGCDILDVVRQAISAEHDVPNQRLIINVQHWESSPIIPDAARADIQSLADEVGLTICLKTRSAPYAQEFEPKAVTIMRTGAERMVAAPDDDDGLSDTIMDEVMQEVRRRFEGPRLDPIRYVMKDIDKWGGWLENGSELQRIAAIIFLGNGLKEIRKSEQREWAPKLVGKLAGDTIAVQVAALDALSTIIGYVDGDLLIQIGQQIFPLYKKAEEQLDVAQRMVLRSLLQRIARRLELSNVKFIGCGDEFISFWEDFISQRAKETIIRIPDIAFDNDLVRGYESPPIPMPYSPDDVLDASLLKNIGLKLQYVLGEGREGLYEPYEQLMVQEDPALRFAGLMGLWKIYETLGVVDPKQRIVPALMMERALLDDDEVVSHQAYEILKAVLELLKRPHLDSESLFMLAVRLTERLKDEQVVDSRVHAHLISKIADVMHTAIFDVNKTVQLIEHLEGIVRGDTSPRGRAFVLEAFGAVVYTCVEDEDPAYDKYKQTILDMAEDPNPELRAYSVRVIHRILPYCEADHKDLIDALERLREDESEQVKEEIASMDAQMNHKRIT